MNKLLLTSFLFISPFSLMAVVPIHYFTFDDGPNDVVGGVTGEIFGDVQQVVGYRGNAYEFDGSGDYIQAMIDINSATLADLTMGAWVKTDTVSAVRQIISSDNGGFDRSLGLDSRGFTGPGVGWAAFTGNSVIGKTPATVGNWTFVAVAYDSALSETRLYTYDESVGTVQLLTTGYSNSFGLDYIDIGDNPAFFVEFFDGVIDEVFFYDEALTTAELDNLRVNGPEGVPEPSTYALMTLGSAMLYWFWRRRHSAAQ